MPSCAIDFTDDRGGSQSGKVRSVAPLVEFRATSEWARRPLTRSKSPPA
ncbi:hypothetical protein [Streptomyces canarius]